MNAAELDDFLQRLEFSYQNMDWPAQTLALWAEDVIGLDHATAKTALTAMRREHEFPSVAAFLKHANSSGGPKRDAIGRIWSEGAGWLETPESRVHGALELEPGVSAEQGAANAKGARAALTEARRATRAAAAARDEERAEIRAQVDAAAARLRMPEETEAEEEF